MICFNFTWGKIEENIVFLMHCPPIYLYADFADYDIIDDCWLVQFCLPFPRWHCNDGDSDFGIAPVTKKSRRKETKLIIDNAARVRPSFSRSFTLCQFSR